MAKRVLLAATMLGLCCLVAAGQEERRQERRGDDQGPMTPDRFVLHVSAAGIAEVAIGKLAVQKASSEEVRKFAQQLVDDHNKANKELMRIAESKQIPVARDMDAKKQEKLQKLEELSGTKFDREFIMGMVKSHEDSVKLFGKFAEETKDTDLKGFATQTLPTLKEHLKMAKDLADRIK